MHPRLAKKIVTRVLEGAVTRTSYRESDVRTAFQVMGVEIQDQHLAPWNQPAADSAELRLQREAANRDEREKALAHRAAVRAAKAAKREEAIQRQHELRMNILESLRAAMLEEQPTEAAETEVAQTAETEVAQVVETEVAEYQSMNMTELKALCRERGLSGYSSMAKADIIELLTHG